MPQRYSISSRPSSAKKQSTKVAAQPALTRMQFPMVVIVVVIIILGGLIYTFVSLIHKNNQLTKQNNDLKHQLEQLKKTAVVQPATTSKPTIPATGVVIPQNVRDSIRDNISNKNYNALKTLLASSVLVVRAGSAATHLSANQAQSALSYLDGATGSWNYNPANQTLQDFQAGPYGQYFADNSVVGTSSNGYVTSVGVNANGQIDTIFMSNNTSDVVGQGSSE